MRPKRTDDKYWTGTRNFNHIQYESDLEEYIIDLENEAQQLQQTDVINSYFGRISESVFSELKSLDDLIIKIGTTRDGLENISVGDPDDFKSRFKYFKEFLKKEIPEFTEEDILKFDKHFQKFRKIYEWYGAEYFLIAMEYEARNNYR